MNEYCSFRIFKGKEHLGFLLALGGFEIGVGEIDLGH